MSILGTITAGAELRPHLCLVYGPDGVGKSTFASEWPNPVFLDTENGTSRLSVRRKVVSKYSEAVELVKALTEEKHDYKTLVVDTLDWLESMLWKHVCHEQGWKSIESPGYGKGYVEAREEWKRFRDHLKHLQNKTGMNVVLVAHSEIKVFNDPQTSAPYDRYIVKLNEKAASLLREYVECVMFANFETLTKKEKDERKAKAFGDGERYLFTERRPAFDAKNRLNLPFQLKLSYAEFEANAGKKADPEEVKLKIVEMVKQVKDEELKSKVMAATEKAGADAVALDKVLARLRTVLEG